MSESTDIPLSTLDVKEEMEMLLVFEWLVLSAVLLPMIIFGNTLSFVGISLLFLFQESMMKTQFTTRKNKYFPYEWYTAGVRERVVRKRHTNFDTEEQCFHCGSKPFYGEERQMRKEVVLFGITLKILDENEKTYNCAACSPDIDETNTDLGSLELLDDCDTISECMDCLGIEQRNVDEKEEQEELEPNKLLSSVNNNKTKRSDSESTTDTNKIPEYNS